MKIAVFNHSFFLLSETFIYRQVKGLPNDIDATLISYSFTNPQLFPTSNEHIELKRGGNIIDKIIGKIFRFAKRPGFALLNGFRMKKILRNLEPVFIHAHFGFNARDIFPVVSALKIPLIISFHGIDASPELLKDDAYRAMLAKMIPYAAAIIVVSPHMIDTLGLSAFRDKVHLIPYGVDTNEFTRDSGPRTKDHVTILHSGRLVSKKGVPDLVRVFNKLTKQHQNARLVIIGNGPELEEATKAAGANPHIEFLGAQPQAMVKKYMSEADIFVLNSRTSEAGDMEGLPNAILEAMSMQLPVVATYHAGIPQAISDGINGMLVQERDNDALEQKLAQLISDSGLRQRIGEEARRTVQQKFTIENMNNGIEQVYRLVSGPLS